MNILGKLKIYLVIALIFQVEVINDLKFNQTHIKLYEHPWRKVAHHKQKGYSYRLVRP